MGDSMLESLVIDDCHFTASVPVTILTLQPTGPVQYQSSFFRGSMNLPSFVPCSVALRYLYVRRPDRAADIIAGEYDA
jgi:hypothetical protein